MSGRRRSSTTQSSGCSLAARPAPRRRCRRSTMSMSSWPSSSAMLELLGRVVLDDQQALAARRGEFLDARRAPLRGPPVVVGLVTNEKAPRARPCWRSSSSVTICTGMCRVAGSCFSWLSTVQPSMSGRNTSSETAVGWYSRASASASAPRIGDQHLEALVVRQIDQDARVVRIVLDDQQHRVAGLEIAAIVRHAARPALRERDRRTAAAAWTAGLRCASDAGRRRRRADVASAAGTA